MRACRSTLAACAWRRARSRTSSCSVTAALRRGGLAIVPMQRCGCLRLLLLSLLLFGASVVVVVVVMAAAAEEEEEAGILLLLLLILLSGGWSVVKLITTTTTTLSLIALFPRNRTPLQL